MADVECRCRRRRRTGASPGPGIGRDARDAQPAEGRAATTAGDADAVADAGLARRARTDGAALPEPEVLQAETSTATAPAAAERARGVHRHGPVVGGPVDVRVDGVTDRLALLLGDVPEQPRGARQQARSRAGCRPGIRGRPGRRRRRPRRSARGCGRGWPDAPGRWRRRVADAGRAVPLSPAIRYITAVRGSATLCTGWPSPGTSLRASRWRATAAVGQRVPARVVLGQRALLRVATASARNRPQSSVTPRKREPPPSSPAASAPWIDSGAPVSVRRVRDGRRGQAVVGERHQHRFEDLQLAGRRTAARDEPERQLAEADLPHQLPGEVVAEQRDRIGVGVADRRRVERISHCGEPFGTCESGVELASGMSRRQLMLGDALGRGARQRIEPLPVSRHLERRQPLRRPTRVAARNGPRRAGRRRP